VAFTFNADPQALIRERASQFASLGVPPGVIERVTAQLKDLWSDEQGGWAYEWSIAARVAHTIRDYLLASLLYGIGKYPCLGNTAHKVAYRNQLEMYLRAAKGFSEHFERRILLVRYDGTVTRVAVHLLRHRRVEINAPLVLILGGIDSCKMDIHNTASYVSKKLGVHVALVDMPGVGESEIPNAPHGDLILQGVLQQLRSVGDGRVGIFAFGFGGLWAVKLALTGRVDVAAAVGASVSSSFEAKNLCKITTCMQGVLGNSLFRDATFPDLDSFARAMAPFSLRTQGLYDWRMSKTPLLLVNGCEDPYIPHDDVLDFCDRPNTLAQLIPYTSHCAAEIMPDLMRWMLRWFAEQLWQT
jgi:esterase FrsA